MSKEQVQTPQFRIHSFQGDVDELKKKIRQQWGSLLNDEEIEHCTDQRERFLDAVKEKYGLPKEKAEKMLRDMEQQCRDAA